MLWDYPEKLSDFARVKKAHLQGAFVKGELFYFIAGRAASRR